MCGYLTTSIKGHPATKFLITWSNALTSDRCNSLKEGNHTLLDDSSLQLANTKTFNDFEHKNTWGNLYCQLSSLPHFWSLWYLDITLKCKVNALVNERFKIFLRWCYRFQVKCKRPYPSHLLLSAVKSFFYVIECLP